MVAGRPREWDRDQIREELLEWVTQDDAINLNKFCCTRNPPLDPSKISIWAKECDEFRKAYYMAKAFIAVKREEWVATERLHQSAYNRNSKVYDVFERDEGREEYAYQKEIDAKAGKEIMSAATADIKDRLDQTLAQITGLQSSVNKATSKTKSDSKS